MRAIMSSLSTIPNHTITMQPNTIFPGDQNLAENNNSNGAMVMMSASSGTEVHCHSKEEMSIDASQMSPENKSAMKRLALACLLVAMFITAEVIGGYASGSLAIMGDAAHMFSDLASFMVSLLAIWIGSKRPKRNFNFGYARAEVLGALLTIVIIWYVTGVLVYLAIHRIQTKEFEVEGDVMIIVAALAVGFNVVLGLLLHGLCHIPHSHGHSHGHSHLENQSDDEEASTGFQTEMDPTKHHHINVRAALIHVLGDFLQSVGVLISSIVIKLNPDYKIADPICTILFALIVFSTTFTILKDTLNILMEGKPSRINYSKVKRDLLKINGVVNVHDLKLWAMTMNQTQSVVHLVVDENVEASQVLKQALTVLRGRHRINKATVQLEKSVSSIDVRHCRTCSEDLE